MNDESIVLNETKVIVPEAEQASVLDTSSLNSNKRECETVDVENKSDCKESENVFSCEMCDFASKWANGKST